MKEYSIGVFDCGTGGLALVNELNLLLPSEKVMYFSESLGKDVNVDDKETIKKYTADKIESIKKYCVKAVISCCNEINYAWGMKIPQTDIAYTGTFLPASQAACASTRNNRIAVIGSPSIVKKGAYAKILKNIRSNITVTGVVCPYLSDVQTAEESNISKEKLLRSTADIFEKLREEKVDTVIVADGYYQLIRDELQNLAEDSFIIISPYEETAKKVYNDLLGSDLLTDREDTSENIIYFSEDETLHRKAASAFLKRATEFISVN